MTKPLTSTVDHRAYLPIVILEAPESEELVSIPGGDTGVQNSQLVTQRKEKD